MSTLVNKAEQQLREIILAAFAAAVEKGELPAGEVPAFKVEIPADRSHGDYAANAALVSAKVFRLAPPKIAAAVSANMELAGTYFESCSVAGAGFLNFTLGAGYYADILQNVAAMGDGYGAADYGAGQKVLVEFVSANPTGPMHVGNARGGALGDCLASVLEKAGYYVEREFYVNDAGNQIEKFGLSLELRYRQLFGDPVEMPEDSYHGQDIIDHAKGFAAVYGDKYIAASEEERRKALVDYALPLNIAGLERDLLAYRIRYDTWFRESTLHQNGEVARIIELMKSSGYTYEKDGAVWFKAEQFGCDKDFVLVRANGLPTYVVPDIAYHYNKLVVRGFDRAIDVLGADHHGHMSHLSATLKALGLDADKRLTVVLMQMVRLINKDGEVIKASKRSGKAITLVSLLDEVPTDAARFFFNLREANTHCDFNLDLAVEQSSQNPVYYCQYAHARICSILSKMHEKGIEPAVASREALCLLTSPEEKELVRHIAALTGTVIDAAEALDPSKITKYAIDLAALFHKFYNAQRVDVDDAALRDARLALCIATKTVMKNVLAMLKIDAPESM